MRRSLIPGAVALAIVATACSDGQLLGPSDSFQTPTPLFSSTIGGVECDLINFNGFTHGVAITSVSLFAGDATLSLSGATAYDSERWGPGEEPNETHEDTQRRIGCNDAANGGNGTCDGIMAVVPDANFAEWGDDPAGGSMTLSGFSAGYTWTLPSYDAMDDDGTGQKISLFIDGSPAGASKGIGDGSVETVTTTGQPITIDAEFTFEGSGGIDDIMVCREPEPEGVGRMTGGGGYLGMTGTNGEDVRVSHGFTVHCDVDLTNNLNINWAENHVKIEKEFFLYGTPICTDEDGVNPEPPPAPFDTFEGIAPGTLNGVPGAEVWFILQDAGEPGGKSDKAAMQIMFGGDVILTVGDVSDKTGGLALLQHGNLQAHYDQPHGNKPVK